jgi:hypothetical protein
VQEINEKEKKELIQELNRKYKGDFSFLENYLIFKNSENKYYEWRAFLWDLTIILNLL